MEETYVTYHGEKRIKHRVGVGRKASQRLADRALEHGIKHNETKGSLKRFLDRIYFTEEKVNNLRIYGKKVYLFVDKVLVTVLDLPSKYNKVVDRINKKRKEIED